MDKGPGKPGIASLICSIPMNLFVYPMIVLLTLTGIVSFPILFGLFRIFTSWDRARIMRYFIWFYGKGWVAITRPFVKFVRTGFTKEIMGPAYVMVINHLSFFDFYCMGFLPFSNIVAAVRSWPFKMPWYAPFMRLAGYMDVESLGPSGSVSAAAGLLSEGCSIIFYPEGHRSKDGKLQRFFSGAFKVSVETGAKVLPLCLVGTDVLLPPGRWWMLPSEVHVKALAPIDPGDFAGPSAHIDLRKHTKAMMEKAILAMRGS